MRKMFFVLPLVIAFTGCTKDSYLEEPDFIPTKDLTLENSESLVVKKETIRVGRERVEVIYTYYESDAILEATAVDLRSGSVIGSTRHQGQADGSWTPIGIESAPCWCDPQCDSYNESLCNWWKCVDNTLSNNGAEVTIGSVLCPECGAIIVSYVFFACAQPGAPTGGF